MVNNKVAAAAVAKALGKRKAWEAVTETPAAAAVDLRLNLQGPHHHHHASSSRNRQILNNINTAPFSYMALLTADHVDKDEDEHDHEFYPMANDIKNQSEQINQMISYHNENLKQSIIGMLEKNNHSLHCAAEERAAKRQRHTALQLEEQIKRNAELLRLLDHYKAESERLQRTVRYHEEAAISRRNAENAEEEGESSFEDPDRVRPVRLDCKVCTRQLASVMVWPCRHVCVCTHCETTTKYCPVCRTIKTTSVEICLPLD